MGEGSLSNSSIFAIFANFQHERKLSDVLIRSVARGCRKHYGSALTSQGSVPRMLSSIFIALFQAVAGDPAVATTEAPAAAEAPAQAATPAPAPRTERRRVCERGAATGSRSQARRCRTVEVPVETPAPAEAEAENHQGYANHAGGNHSAAPAPTPSPQN
jgi:hypothetical protein